MTAPTPPPATDLARHDQTVHRPVLDETARILIVDDLEPNALLLGAMLDGLEGAEVTVLTDARVAVEHCVEQVPDLVLLDYQMPEIDGLTCLREIRQRSADPDIPVLMVTADGSAAVLRDAFEAGATDFLRKPVDATELLARCRNLLRLRSRERALKQANAELDRLASLDDLTGTLNRRRFMEQAMIELDRAMRHDHPVSVAMLDLDRFKAINDTRGHGAGDAALVALGDVCHAALRTSDLLGRLGGEEFVALLIETDMPKALEAAERLRARIAAQAVVHDGAAFHVTASVGVATWTRRESLEDMLRRADQAMYRAKAEGRDRVVAAEPDPRVSF